MPATQYPSHSQPASPHLLPSQSQRSSSPMHTTTTAHQRMLFPDSPYARGPSSDSIQGLPDVNLRWSKGAANWDRIVETLRPIARGARRTLSRSFGDAGCEPVYSCTPPYAKLILTRFDRGGSRQELVVDNAVNTIYIQLRKLHIFPCTTEEGTSIQELRTRGGGSC